MTDLGREMTSMTIIK